MTTRRNANIKAIMKALCRIEDEATELFVSVQKTPSTRSKKLMKVRVDIDRCVRALGELTNL